MEVFISNQIEKLSHLLLEKLNSSNKHPLEKKWIIVPNEYIKQEILYGLAKKFSIVTGYKTLIFTEAFKKIFPDIPCYQELFLKVHQELKYIPDLSISTYLSEGSNERYLVLCHQITINFLYYLRQTPEHIHSWLKLEGWQQNLWKRIFKSKIPWQNIVPLEGSILVFLPFHLTFYQFQALKNMNSYCFIFSPCSLFWGDFKGMKEQLYFLKKSNSTDLEQFQNYFSNDHPLLSNWGKCGQNLLKVLEDENQIEAYESLSYGSVLSQIQEEMLSLVFLNKIPDSSIQIHSASSKFREIEIVWEIIQQSNYEASDIVILAPNIEEYVSLIEFIFHQRKSRVEYQILDLSLRRISHLARGFEILIQLPFCRYSSDQFENLLFCPAFMKRFQLDDERLSYIKKWLNEASIHFDLGSQHNRTWQAGIRRLMDALVLSPSHFRSMIEFSEAPILNIFVEILQLFEKELDFLINPKGFTLKEWSEQLEKLVEVFFISDDIQDFKTELQRIKYSNIEGKFSFETIKKILDPIFNGPNSSIMSHNTQTVKFISLKPGAIFSKKMTILIGMEEGNFPRNQGLQSLRQIYSIDQEDEDKYLFLQALVLTQCEFIMTYSRIHHQDGKNQKPSSLIQELIKYVPGLSIIEHPCSSFDQSYFGLVERIRSSSTFHFEICQQMQLKQKIESPFFILSPLELNCIHVDYLKLLARHPIKFFLEKRLKLNFSKKEKPNEFTLSPLDLFYLRKESMSRSVSDLIVHMQDQGKLPSKDFGEVAIFKIQKEINFYKQIMDKLEVQSNTMYSLILEKECLQVHQVDEKLWVYPAIRIKIASGKEIAIVGKIDGLCHKGILFHGEDSLQDILKIWPIYLITKILQLPHPCDLLLTKKGKIKNFKILSPDSSLQLYMDYFFKALTTPSPLMPQWARSLFKEGKIPDLEEDEDIVNWMSQRSLLPPFHLWEQAWIEDLKKTFYELI